MCISYSLIQTKEVLPTLWISNWQEWFHRLWDFELLAQASNSVVLLESRREGKNLVLPLETILCARYLNSSVFVQGTGKGGFCLVQHHKHIKYESSPDSGNALRVSCWEMSLCALPGDFTWNKCAWSFPSAPAQCLWAPVLRSNARVSSQLVLKGWTIFWCSSRHLEP